MKDMSEEKDVDKTLLRCSSCDRPFIGANIKTVAKPICKECWNKSLESRLKEAEEEKHEALIVLGGRDLACGISDLKQRLEEIEKKRIGLVDCCLDLENRLANSNKRLSQAEAEKEDLVVKVKVRDKMLSEMEAGKKHDFKLICEGHENQINTREVLEARLSHLMDVAGKMAGALEPFGNWASLESVKDLKDADSKVLPIRVEFMRIAKLALASWQDFNNK